MKRIPIGRVSKIGLVILSLYEASLVINFVLAAAFAPILFLMGSDADPGNVHYISMALGLGIIAILWACTPLSFALNWYMIFSKKPDHPQWFVWLIPLPFLALLTFSLIGLGFQPFIPLLFLLALGDTASIYPFLLQ